MDLPQVGIAAAGKGAQQVERGGGLRIGAHHALRIVAAAGGVEFDAVDIVAKVAGQRHIADRFGGRGTRLGKLPCHAPHLHNRTFAGESHDDCHLQQHTEGVADVVGVEFGKAFGAVATLQQKRVTIGDISQIILERARFACEHQRRIGGQRRFGLGQFGGVLILRQMPGFAFFPACWVPVLGHFTSLLSQLAGGRVGTLVLFVKPQPALRQLYFARRFGWRCLSRAISGRSPAVPDAPPRGAGRRA